MTFLAVLFVTLSGVNRDLHLGDQKVTNGRSWNRFSRRIVEHPCDLIVLQEDVYIQSFTPPKTKECPLKINGWFRCISY